MYRDVQTQDNDCGIYAIVNKVSKKFYIGRANNLVRRKTNHLSLLKRNKHVNLHLQSAWNLYGREAFDWKIIEKCEKSNADIIEKRYLDIYYLSANCYNMSGSAWGGSSKGHKKSPETIKRMSLARMGWKPSESSLLKMRLAKLGKKTSEETKRKLSAINKGRKPSPNTITASINKLAKTFNVIGPDGKEMAIYNLTKYCRDNGLIVSCMQRVIYKRGGTKSHRGYRNVCELNK